MGFGRVVEAGTWGIIGLDATGDKVDEAEPSCFGIVVVCRRSLCPL